MNKIRRNINMYSGLAILTFVGGILAETSVGQTVPLDENSFISVPLEDEFVKERLVGMNAPDSISDANAINFFYKLILALSNKSGDSILGLAEYMGITEAEILQLVDIANSATFDSDRKLRIESYEFCNTYSIPSENITDEMLVHLYKSLEDIDAAVEDAAEEYFHNEVSRVLGRETYEYLINWIRSTIKPSINVVKVDHYKRDFALQRDRLYRVDIICNR